MIFDILREWEDRLTSEKNQRKMLKNGPSTGRNGKITMSAHAYDPEKIFLAQNVEKSMDF